MIVVKVWAVTLFVSVAWLVVELLRAPRIDE